MTAPTPDPKLFGEQLVPLSEVPTLLPRRRNRKVHYQTVYRWTRKGVNGRRLESIKVGRTRFTSIEALKRFIDDSTVIVGSDSHAKAVEEALERAGI